MNESLVRLIRENYDRLASEYGDHLSNELESKPLGQELVDRLVTKTSRSGDVCDMG